MTVLSPRRLLPIAAAALAALACLAPPASAGVSSSVSAILAHYGLAGSATGVSVWREDGARALYARNARALLAPASNEKLITATTALSRWGAGHRFKTQLYLPAAPPTGAPVGVVQGDLYVKGYGDPSLSTDSFQRDQLGTKTATLAAFVTQLQQLGVTGVTGHVVADASWFDDLATVPGWTPGVLSSCSRLSALTVNEGLKGDGCVADPALRTASLLTAELRRAGITVGERAETGVTPPGSYLAVTLLSAPLSDLVRHMDKQSDNFFAEMLVKGLGRDFRGSGTTAAGLRVLRATMDSYGLPRSGYRVHDGSGLSYADRLSARAVTRLLRVMCAQADYPAFDASLSVAGIDGTLAQRMRGSAAAGDFHGKTGTLSIASCLSGYVTDAAGHELVVSMLMNGRPMNVWAAHQAQDAIAETLARARL
jgi:serine-type D-Ala-D-Ala carboxypeptidase/endopeptidase (penicillin-binding protein 4)